MSNARNWWAAASGQAPPRELVEAKAGLSRSQRRAAARAVRRGEAAEDPAVARLAVAIARVAIRRRPGPGVIGFFALLVVGWIAFAIEEFAAGRPGLGVLFAVSVPFGVWVLYRLHPSFLRAAHDAERRNREVLERAGRPYRDDPAPVRPPGGAVALAAITLWLFYALGYGAVTGAMDGRPFDVAHAAGRGAVFATVMTIANLTVIRRRTQRGSHP